MKWTVIVAEDELRPIAIRRMRLHVDDASTRRLIDDYEMIGLVVEVAFGKLFDLPVNMELLPRGDGGDDFGTLAGTIDVKGASKQYWIGPTTKAWVLAREVEKDAADILVLGKYLGGGHVEFMGWERDEEMVKCPTAQFHPDGPVNYYKLAEELRPMEELAEIIRRPR